MITNSSVGYSGTPLWKKLGFKPSMRIAVRNPPSHYADLLADGPNDWHIIRSAKNADAIHLFIINPADTADIIKLAAHLPPAKMLWVSWPKKTSPLSRALSEDDIRKAALACGLVDVKVCAVDADWSGLKLMRRKTQPL